MTDKDKMPEFIKIESYLILTSLAANFQWLNAKATVLYVPFW